jgi:predicted transcriptional regulator
MIKKVYNQERILKLISEYPGISSTQIAEKMQLNRVTIFLYLKDLQKMQKIRIDGKGKASRYFLETSIVIANNLRNTNHTP